jgi:radical SAM protein with 4Fe4S-binding SPASM domain
MMSHDLSVMPEIFSLETILGCNLHCVECAVGNDMIGRKHGRITLDQFKVIADKIRPYCKYMYLHLWGEPMLNREIIPMIKLASEFTRTNISTNAVTLTPDLARELITSGVSDLIVSIDGVSQEVYEKYRVGGKAHKAIEGLKMLHQFNVELKAGVAISPQYIMFKHNQHEALAFQQICHGLGLQPSFKAPYLRAGSALANSDLAQLTRNIPDDPAVRQHNMSDCQNGWNVFTMLLDGSVVACCYDHDGKTNFGNIFEQDVEDIWNSSSYRDFRKRLMTGDADSFCMDNCLAY